MKYLRLIASDIPVAPFLAEIQAHEDAWAVDTSRQDTIFVQRETNTIFLRNAVERPDLGGNENQESVATKISENFPIAMAFLNDFANVERGSLSRAMIVRLKPVSPVDLHIDNGSYYLIRDRYHLVVRSASGSLFRCGDEHVRMREGELWWFNNKQPHCAFNDADEWRIHFIFDLLPPIYANLAVNPMPPMTAAPDYKSAS
jgi:aspartyl/asparaginyl beta-hydroxylase (cupin superfamily)